jgi:hypothetical protein
MGSPFFRKSGHYAIEPYLGLLSRAVKRGPTHFKRRLLVPQRAQQTTLAGDILDAKV